jgi:Xaa-Pro dipeptidase
MNTDDIQQALRDESLDGWLFFDHHHRDPLAYQILSLPEGLHPTRRWYCFVPASGEPRCLVHRIEPQMLDSVPGPKTLYSTWAEQSARLRDLLGDARIVAMQYSAQCAIPYVSMVDAGTVELVRLCGVDVRSSANLVQLFQARWTEDQLESHLAAGRIMDRLRADAFTLVRKRLQDHVPVTEWEVRQFLLGRFHEEGLVTDHGPIVAVNANASNPHYEPSAERHDAIRQGDVLLIDMWAKLNRPDAVYYDITWTGFCGPTPRSEVVNVFDVVSTARDIGVKTVQTSRDVCGFAVDDAVRGYIASHGFGEYFIHRTGHSIGTNVHGAGANMDNFETHDERKVIAQTCFSIEPGVYLPEFGIRSEVNVYVDRDGARVTGEIQRELLILA